MNGKNLYEVLGLAKSASKSDIKKKYRELAKIYHPDKSEDENYNDEKFKEITEAYQTLIDDKLREKYDNPMDPLKIIYPRVMQITLKVSLEDLKFGVIKKIKFKRHTTCKSCSGYCYDRNAHMSDCSICNGTGAISQVISHMHVINMMCPNCRGTGKNIPICKVCGGHGVVNEEAVEEINIKSGFLNNSLVLKGIGNSSLGGSSDLVVNIDIIPHKDITITSNKDLEINVKVPLKDAIYGYENTISILKEGILLKEEHIKTGHKSIFKDKGIGKGSDLIVKYEIDIPNKQQFNSIFNIKEDEN